MHRSGSWYSLLPKLQLFDCLICTKGKWAWQSGVTELGVDDGDDKIPINEKCSIACTQGSKNELSSDSSYDDTTTCKYLRFIWIPIDSSNELSRNHADYEWLFAFGVIHCHQKLKMSNVMKISTRSGLIGYSPLSNHMEVFQVPIPADYRIQ